MKIIEIDDELYAFIASQTKHIGESASEILRRLLLPETENSNIEAAQSEVQEPSLVQDTIEPVDQLQAVEPDTIDEPAKDDTPNQVQLSGDIAERVTTESLSQYDKRVDQFLFILGQLNALHHDTFSKVEELKGKNRLYFATSKEALLSSGSSTNPKAIPNSDYWVVTNNNTGKKVAMIEQVLQILGYDDKVTKHVTALFAPELVK